MSDLFHKRFDIEVPIDEARRRFINRIRFGTEGVAKQAASARVFCDELMEMVCFKLGEKSGFVDGISRFMEKWDKLVQGDFLRCLHVTEALHYALTQTQDEIVKSFNRAILLVLSESEVDLDIAWNGQVFRRKGAQLLDEKLVNDPLHWVRDPKYENVLKPFEKGLKHWMEVHKDSERCGDVVTDMYAALEALSKIVTGRSVELAGNREKFASALGLPEQYSRILKDYVDFGCKFRHSPGMTEPRKYPSEKDTEVFMYMTGLFVRRAIQPK